MILSIASYVIFTSKNNIGHRMLKEMTRDQHLKVHPGTYFLHLCLFDATEYHNLYHFSLRNHQRSPDVK